MHLVLCAQLSQFGDEWNLITGLISGLPGNWKGNQLTLDLLCQ